MEYSILNDYVYENKPFFLKGCDWLSYPLRVALGGKTIEYPSGREVQDSRIIAIAVCCLVVPAIIGTMCLLLKFITQDIRLIRSFVSKLNGADQEYSPFSSAPLYFLSDQPFVNVYSSPLLALSFEKKSLISEEFLKNFEDHLFEEFQEESSLKMMDFGVNIDGELYVQQGSDQYLLRQIIELMDWEHLDERWKNLGKEKTQVYLQKSSLFARLRDPLERLQSPFDRSYPFLRLYTTYGFYSLVNPLIRNGKLRRGLVPYATQEINERLAQDIPDLDIVQKVTKELLFISLMMAGSLAHLPHKYLEKKQVIRVAYIPESVLNMMNEGAVILERGFMSASAAGGGYAGGGPCDTVSFKIKYVITPKNGKHVSEFSDLKENEVLFRPFSQFKICRRSGDAVSGFRIEMEEM